MAEINVTPLVDVMLVLLIIFIITAPMLVQGLKVNLPKQDAPAITSKSDEPVILTLTSDQIILLGDEPVHLKLLADRLGAVLAGSPRPVYLKADESLPYGFVIRVLAVLDQVGVEQVGMVTQPEGGVKDFVDPVTQILVERERSRPRLMPWVVLAVLLHAGAAAATYVVGKRSAGRPIQLPSVSVKVVRQEAPSRRPPSRDTQRPSTSGSPAHETARHRRSETVAVATSPPKPASRRPRRATDAMRSAESRGHAGTDATTFAIMPAGGGGQGCRWGRAPSEAVLRASH